MPDAPDMRLGEVAEDGFVVTVRSIHSKLGVKLKSQKLRWSLLAHRIYALKGHFEAFYGRKGKRCCYLLSFRYQNSQPKVQNDKLWVKGKIESKQKDEIQLTRRGGCGCCCRADLATNPNLFC